MKYLVGVLFAVLATTSQASAQRGLPPMSLTDIKNDIEKIQSPQEKLRTYVELSNRYLRNAPDSLLLVAKEVSQLEGISEEQKEAFSSFFSANAFRLLNADSAIYYADKASIKLRDLEEHDSFLMMENLLAMQYSRRDQYLEAESLFLDAISYQQEFADEVVYPIQYFYGNLGNLYVRVGAHDLAIQMFQKFLEYEDSPAARCNILSKLSNSFLKLNNYDKAIEILSPCLEYENLPPPIQSLVRSNLSSVYDSKGDLETATLFLEQAAQISQNYRIPNISNSHTVRLGELYLDQGFVEKADSLTVLVDNPATSFSRPNEDLHKYYFLSRLALAKQEYEKALDYADRNIQLAGQHELEELLRDIYSIKASALESLGRFDEALENERLQRELDNDLRQQREEWSNNMLSVRYQLQNKEAQLMDANLKIESIRVRNFLIIIGFILVSGYLFYRYRIHYLLKEEKTRNRIARDLHDDLSGTLSSISFFSEAAKRVQKDPNESQRFLSIIDESATEAKEKINDIIWAIDPSKDDWQTFLKKCKRFASDMLDSHDIDYTLDISNDLNFPLTLQIRQNLWLIFKECITNLSKHSKATEASVIFKAEKEGLILEIFDNGVGFDPGQINNGHGVKNMRYRAEAIGGTFTLETQTGEGTKWRFVFSNN
ncbi:tetratricopeptide repeat-containing sensor histidine kinase [Gracilimonas tropica]|uniref:tetratricopeptide repeat-containing sensor histidine kinase n=1 Tax=Gracilimonas tropica TaxID=454600 RepID=UPI00035C3E2B|nr:histidine kinase [Gracilimonas tropica]